MTARVWLVWASRGWYSDRTEYAVCFYLTEQAASARAQALQAKSAEWRERCAGAADPWSLGEQAMADIGDPQWSYYDDTEYSAAALDAGPGSDQIAELRAAVATLRGVETHLRMATNQNHAGYKHSGHWHAADIVARVLALLPPSPPTIQSPTKP